MRFEELISGKLWAVRDDNADEHELEILLDHWNDVVWLRNFFISNQEDLDAYYHVSIEEAIWDTIEDSDMIETTLIQLAETITLTLCLDHLTITKQQNHYFKKTKHNSRRGPYIPHGFEFMLFVFPLEPISSQVEQSNSL